jgi:hypothetical protein
MLIVENIKLTSNIMIIYLNNKAKFNYIYLYSVLYYFLIYSDRYKRSLYIK